MRFNTFNIIVRAIILLTAIPVHEFAHGYIADKLGDPTARYSGRLTLNPMAHFDLIGSMAMLFTGIGWAKPVPINPRNFKDSKKGMAISAAAGPASNIILAAISMVFMKILLFSGVYRTNTLFSTLFDIFQLMCLINISLAIFNLIPIPPLDGSRIFNYFLSDKVYFKIMEYEQYAFYALFAILFLGILDGPLAFLRGIIFSFLDKITYFVDLIFRII